MPQVVAFDDAKSDRLRDKGSGFRTPFLKSSLETPDSPYAFLMEYDPRRTTRPHFHFVDQWQIIVDGKGTLGRHEANSYCVHFSRAGTPYGPVIADSKTGMSFFVLFPRFQPGAQLLPEAMEKLKQLPDRRPWQITRQISFPCGGATATDGTVKLQQVPDIKDDAGLFAYTLEMAPNTKTKAPDPSGGDGQYLIVVKGSLWHHGKEHKALTLVFVAPKEGPFELYAGTEGLEAIIVNFPRTKERREVKSAPSAAGMRRWQCELCSFVYDEAVGLPGDGIAAGTRWENVPERWTCPDCSTSKGDFHMVELQ